MSKNPCFSITIEYDLINTSKGNPRVKISDAGTKYQFNFPCDKSYDCTDYKLILKPALYKIELYAGSGGCGKGSQSLLS